MRIVRLGSVLLLALLSIQLLLADDTLESSSTGSLVTHYTYDATTQILQLTTDTSQPDCSTSMMTCYDSGFDSMGHTYKYTYDESPSSVADFMKGPSTTDSRGNVTRYTYDAADSTEHDPNGLRVTYTYDGNDYAANIDTIEAITPSSGSTYYEYDGNFDEPGPMGTTHFVYDDNPLTCSNGTDPCTE